MAVTITAAEVAAQIRVGDTEEELALVTRRYAYAMVEVERIAPTAPDAVHDLAIVQLVGYLFDQPGAGVRDNYANAVRSSGTGRMLLPWRIVDLGYADAVDAAQAAVGTPGNPVTGLAVVGGQLVVTFADGSTSALDLPAGTNGGIAWPGLGNGGDSENGGGAPAAFESRLAGETQLMDTIATLVTVAASNLTAGKKYRVTGTLYVRAIGATAHNLDAYLYAGNNQIITGESVVDPEGSSQARYSMGLDAIYTMPTPAAAITLRAKEGAGDTIIARPPSTLIVMEVS